MTLPSNYLTASETVALVAAGKLTVTQVAKDHLARYEERDPLVHAWAWLDRDLILKEAARLDAIPLEKRGPLHGVMLGVKDMINTKDMPTQHYSPLYKDSRPGIDAGPVAVCRAAGALVYGKTHTTEFAATIKGPPAGNAYDQRRTPGGSSSGSGAAVSDWQCHLAFGTQTGGSTIRPGSYNGIFAMKPTWGAVSRDGLKVYSITLDTLGLYARSITDLELLAKVFRIEDDVPPPPVPKPLSESKFAYVKTNMWDAGSGPSPELIAAWDKSKKLLVDAGATVVDLELPPEFDTIGGNRHLHIMLGEGRVNFLSEYMIDKDNLDDGLAGHVENRSGISRKMLLAAYDSIAALRPEIDAIAGQYDAIVTPSVPGEAWMGLEKTGDARFCSMWTALHVPCVNVPGFASENGMPIGLTLVAPRYEDQRLLNVSKAVAGAWLKADEEKLLKIPAPEGAIHTQL
ncbi:amidase signature domain-containing protein [Naematelia encephala]|uniref:Amidase signature domain-containing protein n=1 Tax=Naematelia encephala TaxID=71784 RepID=A0A1Y2AN93_9TREE|nr:amidase signature domain-containing protein [Naematelia encephala]